MNSKLNFKKMKIKMRGRDQFESAIDGRESTDKRLREG